MPYVDTIKVCFEDKSTELHKQNTLLNEQLELIFNVAPIIMSVSTISDGRYISVNKAWLETLEYNHDEVIGKSSRELNIFVDFEDRQRVARLIQKDGVVRNQEIRIRTKTGKILTGLFSGDMITLGNEKFFLITVVDITEKRQIEDKMQRMDKLNLLGQMAAGISHEIRNPLSSVYGLLQLLRNKDGCSKYRKEFDVMITELLRANSAVDQFLSLGSVKPLKKDKHNLNTIIQRLYPLISSDAKKDGKSVNLEIGNIAELLLDEGEIRQLILNMVRNGLESMSSGKSLTIRTFKQEDAVVLSFRDEGTGISPEIISNIGTPFFTTKENGTGLGLAICNRIIGHHDAHLKVDSGTDGSTFNIYFSIFKEPA